MRYLLRRALHGLLILFIVSCCTFFLAALIPGNYLDDVRLNPQISPATVQFIYVQHGLDLSLVTRYSHWIAAAASGDLGLSLTYGIPVRGLLAVRIRNTLLLTIPATAISCGLALAIGAWSSQHRGHPFERLYSSMLNALMVFPDAAVALILLLLALRTGWFPLGGMMTLQTQGLSSWQKTLDVAHHLVLPATALVFSTLPPLSRHVQAALSEASNQHYVVAAESLGLPRLRFLRRYVLPGAAAPLLSLSGLTIGCLLSCSLLVEAIMGWPGIGSLLLESALARDLNVVVGGVLASTLCVVSGNFLADFALYLVDPRIRVERQIS